MKAQTSGTTMGTKCFPGIAACALLNILYPEVNLSISNRIEQLRTHLQRFKEVEIRDQLLADWTAQDESHVLSRQPAVLHKKRV